MSTITVQEIQTDPAGFLRRVEAGELLVVVRNDRQLAEIRPIELCSPAEMRPFGLAQGQFIVPDEFDDPLHEHILAEFEGR